MLILEAGIHAEMDEISKAKASLQEALRQNEDSPIVGITFLYRMNTANVLGVAKDGGANVSK